jgi:hypothetical protein
MRLGYAKRNRGTGVLNWTYLSERFPAYADHIRRVRKNHPKLLALRNRLEVSK